MMNRIKCSGCGTSIRDPGENPDTSAFYCKTCWSEDCIECGHRMKDSTLIPYWSENGTQEYYLCMDPECEESRGTDPRCGDCGFMSARLFAAPYDEDAAKVCSDCVDKRCQSHHDDIEDGKLSNMADGRGLELI